MRRYADTYSLSPVDPHHTLGYPGEYFPGYGSGFLCQFVDQNFLLTLSPKENDLLTRLNLLKVSYVHHNLIHGHPA